MSPRVRDRRPSRGPVPPPLGAPVGESFAVLVSLRVDVTGSLKAVRSTTQPRRSRAMQPVSLTADLAEIRRTLTEREREEQLRVKQLLARRRRVFRARDHLAAFF